MMWMPGSWPEFMPNQIFSVLYEIPVTGVVDMPKDKLPENLDFLSKLNETMTRRVTLELTMNEVEVLLAYYFAKHFEFEPGSVVVELGDKFTYFTAQQKVK